MIRILIVSPHRDDAAFSCAIAIRALSNVASITVANYFTISEYAPFRTDELRSVSELRLLEDQKFVSLAGIALEDLNLTDAPQRLEIDVSEISTLRPLETKDAVPRETISKHVLLLAPDLVMLPLAIGDHIDHRIAQAGVLDTGIPNLAFYEDLPYSARANETATEDRASSLQLNLSPKIFHCAEGRNWKARCASLLSFTNRVQHG